MAVCVCLGLNTFAPHQHGKEDRRQRPHRAAGWETLEMAARHQALAMFAMQESTERMAQLEAEAARHEFATECEGFLGWLLKLESERKAVRPSGRTCTTPRPCPMLPLEHASSTADMPSRP